MSMQQSVLDFSKRHKHYIKHPKEETQHQNSCQSLTQDWSGNREVSWDTWYTENSQKERWKKTDGDINLHFISLQVSWITHIWCYEVSTMKNTSKFRSKFDGSPDLISIPVICTWYFYYYSAAQAQSFGLPHTAYSVRSILLFQMFVFIIWTELVQLFLFTFFPFSWHCVWNTTVHEYSLWSV